MPNFVLVHGGWGGGWEWRTVGELLAAAGHRVARVTLTGLGERVHLASPAINLDTHIDDVLMVLEYEDLEEVVLVGQSYGGAVVTGVADRASARIARLVYLDAFAPRDGESVNDLSPPAFVERMRTLADESGEGWRVPLPFAAGDLGPAEIEEWYVPKLVAHPLATLEQPLRLTGAGDGVAKAYIDCRPHDVPAERWVFSRFSERAQVEGWEFHHLPVGHDAQVLAPRELADLLETLASR